MAAHARLKNEFTEDEKYHNHMTWLNWSSYLQEIALIAVVDSLSMSVRGSQLIFNRKGKA